jgi:hypothetical protein
VIKKAPFIKRNHFFDGHFWGGELLFTAADTKAMFQVRLELIVFFLVLEAVILKMTSKTQ